MLTIPFYNGPNQMLYSKYVCCESNHDQCQNYSNTTRRYRTAQVRVHNLKDYTKILSTHYSPTIMLLLYS
jgi:hypothetical protein